MNRVTVFGASYSVYVRIVRLVLEEIGVPYQLVEIDIFAKETLPPDYAERHPFGRIPAFEHDGFRLFETDAIAGYIVEQFGGGALLPADARHRARMRQIMRILDNYAYPHLVWGIYVEEMERDRRGRLGAEELARAAKCLTVLSDLAGDDYMAGGQPVAGRSMGAADAGLSRSFAGRPHAAAGCAEAVGVARAHAAPACGGGNALSGGTESDMMSAG